MHSTGLTSSVTGKICVVGFLVDMCNEWRIPLFVDKMLRYLHQNVTKFREPRCKNIAHTCRPHTHTHCITPNVKIGLAPQVNHKLNDCLLNTNSFAIFGSFHFSLYLIPCLIFSTSAFQADSPEDIRVAAGQPTPDAARRVSVARLSHTRYHCPRACASGAPRAFSRYGRTYYPTAQTYRELRARTCY